MKFKPLPIDGAFLVEVDPAADERGLFARTFCASEFGAQNLPVNFVQQSVSFNRHRGTLRGLHYQASPSDESKLVRCLHGRVFDVVVDLRAATPGFRRWCSVELTDVERNAVFIPRGCAHGFQTLSADTELLYMIDAVFDPERAAGIRWNDPSLGITWPIDSPILSPRDRALPFLAR